MPKRILLKLSGEALAAEKTRGLTPVCLKDIALEIKNALATKCQLAIVIGGGNIWRGVRDGGGIIDRINDELGESATVVATGGLSKEIINYCKNDIIYNENLLLDGLRIIFEKNN